MKSIFLSDSDEEAIVEFVNSTRDFMTRSTTVSKTNRRKTIGFASSYKELACQDCEEVVRDSTYQIWQAHSKSGQAAEKSTERQT